MQPTMIVMVAQMKKNNYQSRYECICSGDQQDTDEEPDSFFWLPLLGRLQGLATAASISTIAYGLTKLFGHFCPLKSSFIMMALVVMICSAGPPSSLLGAIIVIIIVITIIIFIIVMFLGLDVPLTSPSASNTSQSPSSFFYLFAAIESFHLNSDRQLERHESCR